MNKIFDYTEIVSNGFITSCSYFKTGINHFLEGQSYLNVYQIDGQPSCIEINCFLQLVLDSSLTEEQQAELKTDIEGDTIFIFTPIVSYAEELDSIVNLLSNTLYAKDIVNARLNLLNCVDGKMIYKTLQDQPEIKFEGEHLGQLEWLDYAQYMYSNHQLVNSLNGYNRYFMATGDAKSAFNVGCILSQINLDKLAIQYYHQALDSDFDCNHNIALSLMKLGDTEQALSYINQSNFEINHKSYLLKAKILIEQQDYKQAVTVLNIGYSYLKTINIYEANLIKDLFTELRIRLSDK